jgi:hypothetical protein
VRLPWQAGLRHLSPLRPGRALRFAALIERFGPARLPDVLAGAASKVAAFKESTASEGREPWEQLESIIMGTVVNFVFGAVRCH